jgi:hypothetical protein
LRTLIPIRWRRAGGYGQAPGLGETMEQNALTCPPVGDTITAACVRGKRSRRRPHTAIESSRSRAHGESNVSGHTPLRAEPRVELMVAV